MNIALKRYVSIASLSAFAFLFGIPALEDPGHVADDPAKHVAPDAPVDQVAPYDPARHVEVRYISFEEQLQTAFDRESRLAAADLANQYKTVWGIVIGDAQSSIETACKKAADKVLSYDGYLKRASSVTSRSKDDLVIDIVAELNDIYTADIEPLIMTNVEAIFDEERSYRKALRANTIAFLLEPMSPFAVSEVQAQPFVEALHGFRSFSQKIGQDLLEFVPSFGTAYGLSRVVYDHRTETKIVEPARTYCGQSVRSLMDRIGQMLHQFYGDPTVIQARFAANWAPSHTLDRN